MSKITFPCLGVISFLEFTYHIYDIEKQQICRKYIIKQNHHPHEPTLGSWAELVIVIAD